jgi:hypothetical protein
MPTTLVNKVRQESILVNRNGLSEKETINFNQHLIKTQLKAPIYAIAGLAM